MLKKQELLTNFLDKDLKLQFSKVIDKFNLAIKNYQYTFTDFLPIYNVFLFLKYINGYDIKFKIFGGFEHCERAMICFYPEFLDLEESDFPICILKITYNKKYSSNLTHRDFLGSILGLGISREKIGDIIFQGDIFCFVSEDIVDYIITNLSKVSKTYVKVEKVEYEKFEFNKVNLKEKVITISSLRLDTILSSAFNISRAKSLSLIKSEKVFINWCNQTNPSKILNLGDNITLRGFGKIKINEVLGNTKKGKIILNISSTLNK